MKKTLLPLLSLLVIGSYAQTASISLQLYSADTHLIMDGILMEYNNNYSDSVKLEDAHKFNNIDENLGVIRYGKMLCVERRPLIKTTDSTTILLYTKRISAYQFEFQPAGFGQSTDLQATFVYYNNGVEQPYPVSLKDTTRINISLTSEDTSRFSLNYKLKTLPPTPLDNKLAIYPNPVCNNTISLPVTIKGVYTFQIFNSSGIMRYQVTQDVSVDDGGVVRLRSDIPSGFYYMRVIFPGGKTELTSFLKN